MDSPATKVASQWPHIKSLDGQKRRGSLSTSWRKGWIIISWFSPSSCLEAIIEIREIPKGAIFRVVLIFFEVIYDSSCFSCNLVHLFFREATSLRNPVKTSTLQQDWPPNYKWSQCPIGRGKKEICLPKLFKLCDLLDNLKIIKHLYSWDILRRKALNKDSGVNLGGGKKYFFPNF